MHGHQWELIENRYGHCVSTPHSPANADITEFAYDKLARNSFIAKVCGSIHSRKSIVIHYIIVLPRRSVSKHILSIALHLDG